jgi:ABC-type uncharacterized transport system permease subunit
LKNDTSPAAETMNSPLPVTLIGLALVGVGFAATVGEHLDGVIRVVTLFTLLGTIVAYRRDQRRPGLDPFPIITRWSAVGLGVGVAIELWRAVS